MDIGFQILYKHEVSDGTFPNGDTPQICHGAINLKNIIVVLHQPWASET